MKSNKLFSQIQFLHQISNIDHQLKLETGNRIPLETHSKIREVQQFLHAQQGRMSDIEQLAKQFYMSKRTLQRKFFELAGMSIKQYANHLRVQEMCDLLGKTDLPFSSIALQLGFLDINYAARLFKKSVGVTSKIYRQRYQTLR